MTITDSILEARRRGVKDDLILEKISKENPDKMSAIGAARERGASSSIIVDQIIHQNPIKTEMVGEKSVVTRIKDTVKEVAKSRFEQLGETWKETAEGNINPLETGIQSVGAVIGGVSQLAGEAAIGAGKVLLPKAAEKKIGQAAEAIVGSAPVSEALKQYAAWKESNPRAAANFEGVVDIASIFPTTAGAQLAKSGAKATLAVGKTAVKSAEKGVLKTAKVVSEGVSPKPTVEQAIGQITQGKAGQKGAAREALKAIDVTEVKTYQDLNKKFKEAIPELSKTVDEELSKDIGKYSTDSLVTKSVSKSGKTVQINFVDRALQHLSEFYEKVGDATKKQDVQDIIDLGKSEGLTRKQINELSRQYNVEFGEKAFNIVSGDPLTSVNAQMFENTRSGLKDLARQGIGGDAAKAADAKLSAIYDTKKLVEKQVESVNKLRQKIEERGWIAKGTYSAIKLLNTVSGGAIRGVTDAVLNRGAGLKTLNALDLEKNLKRNLDIIQKALKEETEEGLQGTLKSLKGNDLSMSQNGSVTLVGTGVFGKMFKGIKGNDAIKFLLKKKEGEVLDAFHRKDIKNPISIPYGVGGEQGYGLLHIQEGHPEMIPRMKDIIETGELIKQSKDRVLIEKTLKNKTKDVVAIRLDWNGKEKTWIVSSFNDPKSY